MILFNYFIPNQGNLVCSGYFDNPPENCVNHNIDGFFKPIYDIEKDKIIEGATAEEIEAFEKSKVPTQVSNMKFRLALIKVGIGVNSISQSIEQMPNSAQKEQIQTLWEFANYFERNDKTLVAMAVQFGITNEQLDEIFILANTL